ncbi:MFS transporter [Streptomyces roseolus]|uniref:MFS transporter n=1 Tax=Streptomyces roseolus TaxID=67358 RepID=UPI0019CB9734|nr:MFS transporter [Streptomyces roseolus]GGR41172.1 MFS transporter [Streptomyces roseolus]
MTAAETEPRPSSGTVSTTKNPGRRAWTVTGLLVVFMMVNFADKSVLGLAADEIRADLGLTATQFGLANSAFFLLFSLSGALVGLLLADRVTARWLLLAMAVLWSLAQIPPAIGGGLAVLIGSRLVLGAAEGPAFPVAQQAALSWFPDRRRNLPGALVTLGVTLGVITAAPGLSWVIQEHGWRAALWAVAAVGAAWSVLWLLSGGDGPFRTDDAPGVSDAPDVSLAAATASPTDSRPVSRPDSPPRTSPAPADADGHDPGYRRVLATRTWAGVTLAYFTSYWIVGLMVAWLPSYLRNGLGYAADTAGTLVAAPWAVGAVVLLGQAVLTGRLMRRGVSSRTARGRIGGVMLLIGAVGLFCVPLVDTTTAKTALLALGLGAGGSYATIAATTIAELAPPRRRGGALGTMNALVTTAGLIAPVVVGGLVDTQGNAGYQSAVLLSGALLSVGAVASLTLVDPARDAARLHLRT